VAPETARGGLNENNNKYRPRLVIRPKSVRPSYIASVPNPQAAKQAAKFGTRLKTSSVPTTANPAVKTLDQYPGSTL